MTRNYTVILENLQKEIEKLREEGELPEVLEVRTGPLARSCSLMDLSRSSDKMKSVALEAS